MRSADRPFGVLQPQTSPCFQPFAWLRAFVAPRAISMALGRPCGRRVSPPGASSSPPASAGCLGKRLLFAELLGIPGVDWLRSARVVVPAGHQGPSSPGQAATLTARPEAPACSPRNHRRDWCSRWEKLGQRIRAAEREGIRLFLIHLAPSCACADSCSRKGRAGNDAGGAIR